MVIEPDKGQCGQFLGRSMLTPSAYLFSWEQLLFYSDKWTLSVF